MVTVTIDLGGLKIPGNPALPIAMPYVDMLTPSKNSFILAWDIKGKRVRVKGHDAWLQENL